MIFKKVMAFLLLNCLSAILFSVVCMAATVKSNPLLAKWTGPYGGVPPFNKVKIKDIGPALEEGMAQERVEINAIADNAAPPTFDNTIAALERTGEVRARALAIYGLWLHNLNTSEFQKVQKEMAPKLAAFQDEVYQNAKLFGRIEAVYKSKEKTRLTTEQQRLVLITYNNFVNNGARLSAEEKARVAEINQKLASLQTQFSQNVMDDEAQIAMVIDKKGDLAGLPQSEIDSAAEEAKRRKKKGKWVFANTRSSIEPFLTYSSNRALREKAFRMWTSRGDNDSERNNNKIVTEILKLRLERSKLYGQKTFAHWKLADDTMAKDPNTAMALMMKAWKPAIEAVKKDVATMQALVDQEKGNFKIEPWDYRYYAEKVRKAKYDLDFNIVKPYLRLDNLREAMFASAGKLYGLKFVKVNDVPVFHKDVTVYKVLNATDGFVGLWYFDPYARPGKNSGAWMDDYRVQKKIDGTFIHPLVSNNCNYMPGKPGAPTYLSWDDAVTLFHEFGHALHGLLSDVTYPSLAGVNVPRDFVEFPSQVYENFLITNEVLEFLKDSKGHRLPQELIAKIENAKTFNSGFAAVEFLASAIVDMKLHLTTDTIDPKQFEKSTLKELNMPNEIVMRHRIPAFNHLFSSDGYSAGYYSYLWSQVLSHDAYEAFIEAGNPYDEKVAKRMKDFVLSVGNSVDPAESYRKFRGRDATVDAYLRAQGFPVPKTK